MAALNITTRNKIKDHESKIAAGGLRWHILGMPKLLNDASPAAISLRIRRLREAMGISVEMFARIVGVGQSTVSNWQGARAHQPPGRDSIFAIARATGTSPDWIYRGEGSIPPELLAKIIAIDTGEMKPVKPPRKPRSART